MVILVLGGVRSVRAVPGLMVSRLVLKHGVCDHLAVSHAQGEEALATVSESVPCERLWKTVKRYVNTFSSQMPSSLYD